MFPYAIPKPGPTLRERVRRALKNEGPARGQLAVAQRVLGEKASSASLAEYQDVYRELRWLIADGEVVEKRDDEWGAPSYVYSLKGS